MAKAPEDSTTRARSGVAPAGGRVLVVFAPSGVDTHPLPVEGSLVVGRASDAEVRIDDASVSRRHARIDVRGKLVAVRDLGSRNGTFAGGVRIDGEARPLASGATVGVGDALLVVVETSAWLAGRDRVVGSPPSPTGLVVADPKMKRLDALLDLVAPSDLPVLILGETGTGKEVVATALHERSGRRSARLLGLNCAALPESLLESELFGYERGAFTGATAAKPGLFEAADGGTVFLDELGDMPLATQSKLLRVLESGEVMRIGARTPIRVDVRLLSATHKDLAAAMRDQTFRSDLYFRLSGFTLAVPPLRERPLDIDVLSAHFLSSLARELGRSGLSLAPDALEALRRHAYPGNVRELRSVLARAAVLSPESEIGASAIDFGTPLVAVPDDEAARIARALDAAAGNQSRAAKLLGISRATLVRRLDASGAKRPRKGRLPS